MTRAHWLVLLFVLDEVLSLATPVASGLFALGLIAWLQGNPAARRPADPVWKPAILLLVAGGSGAIVSGTGFQVLFLPTLLLLAWMWRSGTRIDPRRPLVTPRAAMFGVLVSSAFLLAAQFDLDLYSWLRDIPSNRPAGLFLEPSHFALYVGPLWLIAYGRRRYRPALVAALLYFLSTLFSMTLVAVLGAAWILRALLAAKSFAGLGRAAVATGVAAGVLYGVVRFAPDLIEIDGLPLGDYITHRVIGLFDVQGDGIVKLSPLVILQGFEIAGESFVASLGLGVGLGNLGVNEAINATSGARELINRVTTGFIDLNLRDGAILANKLVGELGVLALAVPWMIWRAALRVRAMPPGGNRHFHTVMLSTLCCLVLVRALPYFSAPTALSIAVLASLLARRSAAAVPVRPPRRRRRRLPVTPPAAVA